jgi:hypothetical protein
MTVSAAQPSRMGGACGASPEGMIAPGSGPLALAIGAKAAIETWVAHASRVPVPPPSATNKRPPDSK